MISEAPKNKHQITNKSQAPNSNFQTLGFGIYLKFVICHLGFTPKFLL